MYKFTEVNGVQCFVWKCRLCSDSAAEIPLKFALTSREWRRRIGIHLHIVKQLMKSGYSPGVEILSDVLQ